MQKKIFVPTINEESWKCLLADPDKHWKDGYSAKQAAQSWEKCGNIPQEIVTALNKSDYFKDPELIIAIPEYKVPLPGGNTDSQNDIFALIRNDQSLISASLEAKSRECFGNDTLGNWIKNSSDGKKERLAYILNKIAFPKKNYEKLRYQLFHRLASAVIMAEKFHAKHALMIIQSFVESDVINHYNDFAAFVEGYGKECKKEEPITIAESDGICLSVL